MKKVIGYYKSCFTFRSSVIGSLTMLGAVLVITMILSLVKYDVKINDNGKIFSTAIYSKTVEDALREAEIKVSEYDEITPALDANLRETKNIIIKRANKVLLSVNGKEKEVYTTLRTVGELLAKENITVDDSSFLVTGEGTKIENNLKVEIIPKNYEEEVEIASVPFKTVKRANSNMEKGVNRISKEGVDGEKKVKYKVFRHNGQIIDKQLVGEEITKSPVSKIVEYGTISSVRTSRGEMRYKKEITCTATAYSIKGRTATGRQTQRGVVAVDPRVIPLGSRLYIETADGRYTYGYAVAADTGGAVKGNRVDLYMDTRRECLNFGRRTVKVYVLE